MKSLSTILLLLFSVTSLAQEMSCLDRLLPFNRHSGLHMVTRDEWNDGKENLNVENVTLALRFLINSKLLCQPNEVTIRVEAICNQAIADLPQSNSCFVFTNLGYFVATRDAGRNVNFIFSKDKRFE